MTPTSLATTVPGARAPLPRAVVVLLTMIALLVSLHALHSMTSGHTDAAGQIGGHSHDSPMTAHANPVTADSGASAVVAATVFEAIGVPVVPCEGDCVTVCDLGAGTCAVVFVLAALILLVRFPAMHALLLNAGPRLRSFTPHAGFHVYFPSLSVLSISRI